MEPRDASSEGDAPTLARVLLRSALAIGVVEALIAAALVAVYATAYEVAPLRDETWAPVLWTLAAGAMGGLCFGGAEALSARRHVERATGFDAVRPLAAIACGVLLSALAPLAGDFVLELVATRDSRAALASALDAQGPRGSIALLLSASACLFGPLAWTRARAPERGLAGEVEALALGVGLWIALLALGLACGLDWSEGALDLRPAALSWADHALLLAPRVLLLPLALRAADALAIAALRVLGQTPPPRPLARARTPRRAWSPFTRAQARAHAERAARLGPAGACEALRRAHALDPTVASALAAARALVGLGDLPAARALLGEAVAIAGGRPSTLDLDGAAWSAVRGDPAVEALARAPVALPGRARRGLRAAFLLAALALLAVAPPLLVPWSERAELTRQRLAALAAREPSRWLALGRVLEAGSDPAPSPTPAWLPALLERRYGSLPTRPPSEDLDAGEVEGRRVAQAVAAYERAAALDDPAGLLELARCVARLPGRAAEAPALLERAARSGSPEAMWRWGCTLRTGWTDLRRDPVAAATWLRRAAENGHRGAMRDLALLLRRDDDPALRAEGEAWLARWWRTSTREELAAQTEGTLDLAAPPPTD